MDHLEIVQDGQTSFWDMGDVVLHHPPFQCLQVGIMLEQRLFIDVEIDHPKDIVIHPERKRALNSPSFFPMSTALSTKARVIETVTRTPW